LFIIIVNVGTTVYNTNFEMQNPGQSASETMQILETFFLCFYISEIVLRLVAHRCSFFFNEDYGWNLLDLVLVIVSIVNTAYSSIKVSFLRGLRVLKLAKILRTIRVVRFVVELRQIVNAFVGSVTTLLWCSLMVFLIMSVVSMLFVQSLASASFDEMDSETEQTLRHAFGSVQQGILTLFWASLGEFQDVYDALQSTGAFNSCIYVLFLAFCQVALWNVTTSIFVDKALKIAQPDSETIMMERRREDNQLAEDLLDIAYKLDKDMTGSISWKEFETFMTNGQVRGIFEAKGITIKDAQGFFGMLSSVSNAEEIDIEKFVAGCLRMKGAASSVDLQTLRYEVHVVHSNIRLLFSEFSADMRQLFALEKREFNTLTSVESNMTSALAAHGAMENSYATGHDHAGEASLNAVSHDANEVGPVAGQAMAGPVTLQMSRQTFNL